MQPDQREFHLKEYDSLRSEVTALLARIENLFKYSFIASATVFAWLLSNSVGLTQEAQFCLKLPGALVSYAWMIPAAFSYLALFLAFVNHIRVQKMGRYLMQLEKHLGEAHLGWEAFSQPGFPSLAIATGLMWFALIGASSYAAKGAMQEIAKAEEGKRICQVQKG